MEHNVISIRPVPSALNLAEKNFPSLMSVAARLTAWEKHIEHPELYC
jgi:hypothetical protein